MSRDNIPGMRMIFVDKEKIAWYANYGYADISKKIKVDSETVFAGASSSKPITAIIALKLCEEGKLGLDENINNWLSGWQIPENDATRNKKVSLLYLLSHTAGLDRKNWSEYSPEDSIPSLTQMLKGEKPSVDKGFLFINEPGKTFKYSNTGYLIVQKAIEDVTGKAFADVAGQYIFTPLNMHRTSFSQPIPPKLFPYKATGYSSNLKPFPYKIYPFEAAGGIWTTPDDLGKFIIALIKDYKKGTNLILSENMTQHVFNKGQDVDKLAFPLWNWKNDIVFRHTGHINGFTSFIFGSVTNEQALIVMTNGENTQDLFDYLQRTVAKEYNWEYMQPEFFTPIKINSATLRRYTGTFDWEGKYLAVTREGEKLFIQINSELYDLTPVGENLFLVSEKSLKIYYPEDKPQMIQIWKANGDLSEAHKIN
ncbi:serine hydrolase domain-containing protein [Chryseobacterium gossypii]|uniref:serine hydrolase domain-containing protein n=1 Tax=Chryseobacterium gossypii TaxID=3231602 RepID=UPI003525F827